MAVKGIDITMSQNYTDGTPANNDNAVAQTERQNFDALLTNHAGTSLPGYAKEGMTFYDSDTSKLHVAKPYGSKAYGSWLMGPEINLFVALAGEGDDGSLFAADVRIQDNTLLSLSPNLWALTSYSPSGGDLQLYFSTNFSPSYFASRRWYDPLIGEPVLWTPDRKLLGKTWETIPTGSHELVYSGSPSPLANITPFASDTLRGVSLEDREIKIVLPTNFGNADHHLINMGTDLEWWENQDLKLEYELYVDGVRKADNRFKAIPFLFSGQVYVILYLTSGASQELERFIDNRDYQLVIRKKL